MMKNENKKDFMAGKILVAPWVTEASTMAVEENKYIFKIFKNANKKQVKEAVESLYGVKVLKVATINQVGKKRIRGTIQGRKSGYKKAIVTIEKGQNINIYENKQ